MPRKLINALTPLTVKNAKRDLTDGNGLKLSVNEKSGARSWLFRYRVKGKQHEMGLGPAGGADAISLANARDLAAALRLKVKSGIDPLEEARQLKADAQASQKAAHDALVTFRDAAEAHLDRNDHVWKNPKHRQQWRSTLATYAYPVIGDLPVSEVNTQHLMSILQPIWGSKPETAQRLRGRIEAVLASAKVQGLREGENPATWRNHLALILPKRSKLSKKQHPSLHYTEITRFISELRSKDATAALALEFKILTAARTSETSEAKWDEVDLTNGVWTVPDDRMKAGKEHRVPLSSRALDILQQLKPNGEQYIFSGLRGGHLSNMAMAMLLRRMHQKDIGTGGKGFFDPKQKRPAVVHGFRATFRTWSDEQTDYPHEMKEMALSHTIPNKSEAAYRRGDLFEKRRKMMEDWATYCESGPQKDGV